MIMEVGQVFEVKIVEKGDPKFSIADRTLIFNIRVQFNGWLSIHCAGRMVDTALTYDRAKRNVTRLARKLGFEKSCRETVRRLPRL